MSNHLTKFRPETVESLFIAFRLTGDPRYREYGWKIFQAIETHCRVETGGYASIINVDEVPVRKEDKMETFLMVSFLWSFFFFEQAKMRFVERNIEVFVPSVLEC
jgi:endoplasmic reticulum Man9GlcNAc2 1,2-alpha-mannosidase